MPFDLNTNWNLVECQQLQLPHRDHPQDGHTDAVYGVQIQGEHLVSVSADHTTRVWDLRTQRLLYPPLVGHTGSVTALQFDATAHSGMIYTGDTVGNVMVWRFSTGEAVKMITKAHNGTVLSLDFDQRYLVTGGKDGEIKLWNRQPLDADHINIPAFAAGPTERDRYQEYSLLATFHGHNAAVTAVRLKDDVLVSGSGDRTNCIWSLQTGKILHKVNIHQRGIACLQYNGRFIVSGSTDESIRIYDVGQEQEIACLRGHTDLIRSVKAVFNDDGEVVTIISGSYDGSVSVWEQVPGSKEWQTLHQFHFDGFQTSGDGHSDKDSDRFSNRVFSVDVDANRFVCSGQGPMIRFWNLHSPNT